MFSHLLKQRLRRQYLQLEQEYRHKVLRRRAWRGDCLFKPTRASLRRRQTLLSRNVAQKASVDNIDIPFHKSSNSRVGITHVR